MLKLLRCLTLFIALFAAMALMQGRALAADKASAPAAEQSAEEKTAAEIDTLINILEDETARNALLKRLRDSVGETEKTVAVTSPKKPSLGSRIAKATQGFAEGAIERALSVSSQVGKLPERFSKLDAQGVAVLWKLLRSLGLIIVVTAALYLLLRRFSKRIYRYLSDKAKVTGFIRSLNLWIVGGLVDAVTIVATCAAGYGVALLAMGDVGEIGIHQTMFLNAFLLVGAFKVVARMFIAPNAPELRPLPVTDGEAKYLSRRIGWIASIVGYGQLLVVPVVNANVSDSLGYLISTLIALSVVVYLIVISIKNRASVARWLVGGKKAAALSATDSEEPAEEPHGFFPRLAVFWFVPVVIYLCIMFAMVLASPPSAVFKSFVSSGQMVLVIMFGITLSRFLDRMSDNGIPVPASLELRVPTLRKHLNRFLPVFLSMIHYLIIALAVLLMLSTIEAINLPALIASPAGLKLVSVILAVLGVLFVSFMIWIVLNSWVDYRLNPSVGKVATARETTLLTLLRNAATGALAVITLMFVLSEIGLDIAPLLASAGVLGLAIGFGAQKMVQDIITGIFIQIENAMNVGDYVTLGAITGKVEKLTTRSVSIRDRHGAFHIMPFSSVDMVTSYARDFCYFLCDMGVGYSEDADKVKQAMFDAYDELMTDPVNAEKVLGDLEWYGLQNFGDSAVVFRIKIKCRPGTHWSLGRAYRGILKKIFDERNIEIPFPHQTIYFGDSGDKEGGPAKLTNADTA